MPIYEYGCYDCHKRVSVFFRSFSAAEKGEAKCPRCSGINLKRLVSKVSTIRSEERRLENLADPSSLGAIDEDNPKAIAKWMKEMGNEMGEDVGPEFDEVITRLESGQSPEDIERDMPELADTMGGGMPDGGMTGGGASDDWFG